MQKKKRLPNWIPARFRAWYFMRRIPNEFPGVVSEIVSIQTYPHTADIPLKIFTFVLMWEEMTSIFEECKTSGKPPLEIAFARTDQIIGIHMKSGGMGFEAYATAVLR